MRTYLIHFLICIICNQNTQRTRLGRCCSFEAPPSSDPNPPRRPLKVTDISSILSSRQFAVVGLVVAGIVVCKRQRTQFSNSHACSQHSGNPCLYPFSSFSFFPFPAFPLQTSLFDAVFRDVLFPLLVNNSRRISVILAFEEQFYRGSK